MIRNNEQPQDVEVKPAFERELQVLINKYSKENGSNTPDYILAEYLNNCLNAYNRAVVARDFNKKR